jgi:tRNA nucleotidyltransferase (CCA-adding enzyme)
MNKKLNKILTWFHENTNITSFFVGGCVRDELLGKVSDDIDICLVGVENAQLVTDVLLRFSDSVAAEVGNEFPVWIATIDGEKFDFALARKENKTGKSRTDFACLTEGVTIEEDLKRRDLTINAMAVNCVTNELVDPFDGSADLAAGVAKEVSEAFAEDPLRVLRAARFISRFNLTPTSSLVEVCRGLSPEGLSMERVGMELDKTFKQAETPSLFFEFLLSVGWLGHFFPEVGDLVGLEQDSQWHPEGDVFTHTMHCVDQANDPLIRCTMLCHDLGKVNTTEVTPEGRITAKGHAKAGVALTKKMLKRVKFKNLEVIDQVATLVELHMFHANPQITRKAVRKAVRKLEKSDLTFDQLVEVCRCDVSGRPPLPPHTPEMGQEWAKEVVENNETKPIVDGRMLMAEGFKPGRELGKKKAELLELQDEGVLTLDNWKTFV